MILSDKQLQLLTNEDGLYDCRLIKQRFAFKLFGDQVSPLGDTICFISPTTIGPFKIDQALVLAAELPNTDMFGGACFLRLYLTQLGSLLSVITGKECFVDESSLFIDGKQASLSVLNKVKDSVVFHIIFATDVSYEQICEFPLTGTELNEFQDNAIKAFSHLTKSIFVETRRDNF